MQGCPWLAKCPAGSASADISLGGFFALFLILMLLWLAYVAFSAYIKCAACLSQKPSVQKFQCAQAGMCNGASDISIISR